MLMRNMTNRYPSVVGFLSLTSQMIVTTTCRSLALAAPPQNLQYIPTRLLCLPLTLDPLWKTRKFPPLRILKCLSSLVLPRPSRLQTLVTLQKTILCLHPHRDMLGVRGVAAEEAQILLFSGII